MTGYYEDDPRDLFQTCPGCQAEIARDSDQCQFCDHQFDEGQKLPADFDAANRESRATESKSSRYSVILALNIATGLIGVLAASLHEQDEWRESQPISNFRQIERDELIRLLQKSDDAERRAYSTQDNQTLRPQRTVIRFSFQSGGKVDDTQSLSQRRKNDPLEWFRVPESDQ